MSTTTPTTTLVHVTTVAAHDATPAFSYTDGSLCHLPEFAMAEQTCHLCTRRCAPQAWLSVHDKTEAALVACRHCALANYYCYYETKSGKTVPRMWTVVTVLGRQ